MDDQDLQSGSRNRRLQLRSDLTMARRLLTQPLRSALLIGVALSLGIGVVSCRASSEARTYQEVIDGGIERMTRTIRSVVPDPERAQVAGTRLEALRETEQVFFAEMRETRAHLEKLLADYDTPREQIAAELQQVTERRRVLARQFVDAMVAVKAELLPAEWDAVLAEQAEQERLWEELAR